MPADVGAVRTAIAQLLADLPDPLRAVDVSAGNEFPPCAIVYPRPAPESSGFRPTNCGLRYYFTIEAHASLAGGTDNAQRAMDTYISPSGTHANSIEGALWADKTLGGLASTLVVDQFRTYALGRLNSEKPNTIVATIPLYVDVA